MIKIILTTAPTYKGYSIEAGRHDGINHFDHHGEFKDQLCPANNKKILPIIEKDAFIEITHVDTDTLLGLYRLLGYKIPDINLEEVEKIDTCGPSAVNPLNRTLMYMKGITSLACEWKLRSKPGKDRDIFAYIAGMYIQDEMYYIVKGSLKAIYQEEFFQNSLFLKDKDMALYYIKRGETIDTGRPYADGINHFVLYSEATGAISIFRKPELTTVFNDKNWGKILFKGHAGACGSPRGTRYSLGDAKRVFKDVFNYVNAI
jgi:hypothetical protein